MSVQIQQGFLRGSYTTSTATTCTISGGWTPSFIIFTAIRKSSTNSDARDTANLAVGFWAQDGHATGASMATLGMFMEDNVTVTDTTYVSSTTECIVVTSQSSGTINYNARVQNVTAGEFEVYWVTGSSDVNLRWMAFGSDQFPDAYCDSRALWTSVGANSVTGYGFQPQGLITASWGSFPLDFTYNIWVSDQSCGSGLYNDDNDNPGTEWSSSYVTPFLIQHGSETNPGVFTASVDWTRFSNDGYDVQVDNKGENETVISVAFSCTSDVVAGSFLTGTSATTVAVSGVGFTPEALFLTGGDQDTSNTGSGTVAALSIGAIVGATTPTQYVHGVAEIGATNPTVVYHSDWDTKAWGHALSGDVRYLDWESWDSDGFTVDILDPPTTSTRVNYIAFGSYDSGVATKVGDISNYQTVVSGVVGSTIVSNTLSPWANSLIVITGSGETGGSATTGISSVTDTFTGTGSWTVVAATLDDSTYTSTTFIAYAKAGASPGSGTITVTFNAGMTRKVLSTAYVPAGTFDSTTPVAQSATNTGSGSTLATTLGATPDNSSIVVSVCGDYYSGGSPHPGIVHPSGFIYSSNGSGANGGQAMGVETAWDRYDGGTGATWSGLQSLHNGAVTVEIQAPAAATGNPWYYYLAS